MSVPADSGISSARWAFDTALSAPGGETTVRSPTRRPKMSYAGDATAVRYVRHQGITYRLRSSVDPGGLLVPVFGPVFLIGVLLLVLGIAALAPTVATWLVLGRRGESQ